MKDLINILKEHIEYKRKHRQKDYPRDEYRYVNICKQIFQKILHQHIRHLSHLYG